MRKILNLWSLCFNLLGELRPAFSRLRTWHWFLVAVIGMTVRWGDRLGGVSAIMRKCWLETSCYRKLLHFFHSSGINVDLLQRLWTSAVMRLFPCLLVNGRVVIVGDGIKNSKEGKRMPGVKLLHQESTNNHKPEWIMGHMCQSVGMLVMGLERLFCVPLATEIHDGIVTSNRDKRTLQDKLMALIKSLKITCPWYLVADAWYGCKSVVNGLPKECHLVTRLKMNAVGWLPANPARVRSRGRPRLYGEKVVIRSLFEKEQMQTAKLDFPGKRDFEVSWICMDLLWRPVGRTVRFVLSKYPDGKKGILMSTDLGLKPEEIIQLYVSRFQIEVAFGEQVNLIGAYCYRFWMMDMDKIRRGTLQTYLHMKTKMFRRNVHRKMGAYRLFTQIGMVSQGLCQYVSLKNPSEVTRCFRSWFRTMPTDRSPSEKVAAKALENSLFEFFTSIDLKSAFAKFIWKNLAPDRMPDEALALTG